MDIVKEIAEIKNNPEKEIEFIEKLYGESLYPHQKMLLKFMILNKDKRLFITYPYRNGRLMMRKFMVKWKETFLSNEGDRLND